MEGGGGSVRYFVFSLDPFVRSLYTFPLPYDSTTPRLRIPLT